MLLLGISVAGAEDGILKTHNKYLMKEDKLSYITSAILLPYFIVLYIFSLMLSKLKKAADWVFTKIFTIILK